MFSYAMFLYEMISLYFPFEKQNIMASQIEKLTIQGERPPLHSRVSEYMAYIEIAFIIHSMGTCIMISIKPLFVET